MNKRFYLLTVFSVAVIGLLEWISDSDDGSLLPGLILWTAIIQGGIALVAAAELAQGRWIDPLRKPLLSLYPALMIHPLVLGLFALFNRTYYRHEIPFVWLDPTFLHGRSIFLLIVVALLAHLYTKASLSGKTTGRTLGVFYILLFVLTQSLIAFDWVMSLSYPWVTTLFGGYFFVESFYAGIGCAAILAAQGIRIDRQRFHPILKDCATFIFGFSLLWGGLFYSHYLVIWYANIPEEVRFIHKRIVEHPYGKVIAIVLFLMLVLPFLTLLFQKAKKNPVIVTAVALSIMSGIFIEKIFLFLTAIEINPALAVIKMIILGLPVVALFDRAQKLLSVWSVSNDNVLKEMEV